MAQIPTTNSQGIVGSQSSPASSSPTDVANKIWQKAYEELRSEQTKLLENYETVLKECSNASQNVGLPDQLQNIAATQKRRVQNKQWQMQWSGKPKPLRDTAERIMEIVSNFTSLVGVGMTLAPPFISIPWSTVTALIPLMMNDIKEVKAAVEGLENVTKLLFCYRKAEETFLSDATLHDDYAHAVDDLYKKILEYQALAVQFFGYSTLRRFLKNVAGSTAWQDMPKTIAQLDNDTRRALSYMFYKSQSIRFSSIEDFMTTQEQYLKSMSQQIMNRNDVIAQITEWTSSIPIERDHDEVKQKLGTNYTQSGRWFMAVEEVGKWLAWEPKNQVLWLRGAVGVGKSSMTTILIEELTQYADSRVAFFYCSRKAEKNETKLTARNAPENVLRSLLAQAAVSLDGKTVFTSLEDKYNRDRRRVLSGYGLSAEECLTMLQDMFSDNDKVRTTLVIDALDECYNPDDLLQDLQSILENMDNVRLYVSSRFEIKVDDYFPEVRCITVDKQNAADIENFLDIEIPKRRAGSGLTDNQAERLKKVLLTKASGMFIWVKLQVNLLLDPVKARRIRLADDIEPKLVALESSRAVGEDQLYKAYDDVYISAIGSGKQQTRERIVITVLRWLLCAFRNLTLRELALVACVKPDGSIASGVQEDLVLEFCSNLIIEDPTGIVRLTHLSVRHYLEQERVPPEYTLEETHLQAALTCSYFAKSPQFLEIASGQSEALQIGNVTLTKTFYTYVRSYWSLHCREAPQSNQVREIVDYFSSTAFAGRQQQTKTEPATYKQSWRSGEGPKLSTTSPLEISEDDTNRLTSDHEVGETQEWLKNKLHFKGQDSNPSQDNVGETPLRSSGPALRSHYEDEHIQNIVADIASYDSDDEILGDIRAQNWEAFVTQTVACGTDLSAQDELGNTIVHNSIKRLSVEGLRLVLEAGASANLHDIRGNTALHLAVRSSFLEGIEMLLKYGANRNAKNSRGEAPLHLAVMFQNLEGVEILISAGADVSARDHEGNTAFHSAVFFGRMPAARSLLETGYNVNLQNHAGHTPLTVAIKAANNAMINLLLNNSIEVTGDDIEEARKQNNPDLTRRLETLRSRKASVSQQSKSIAPLKYEDELFMTGEAGLCKFCDVAHWISNSSKGIIHSHWSSYEQLLQSGQSGCQLCSFLAKEFGDKYSTISDDHDTRITISLDLSNARKARYGAKDILEITMGQSYQLIFELCLNTGSEATFLDEMISGRLVATSPLDPALVKLIAEWQNCCHQSHDDCRRSPTPLPTRVLDIGTNAPGSIVRIVETTTENFGAEYAYLSFPWGGSRHAATRMLTSTSMQKLVKGAPVEDLRLPKTVQDSIIIARLLKLKYLWVDCLCIIQDDMEDFWREHPRMPTYIRNASLMLMVAVKGGMDDGVLQPRPEPLFKTQVTIQASHQHITRTLVLRQPLQTAAAVMNDTVFNRAWRLQEALLPKQLLIWSSEQVYWNCRSCLRSEGSTVVQQPVVNLKPRSDNHRPIQDTSSQTAPLRNRRQGEIATKPAHVQSLGHVYASSGLRTSYFSWYRVAMIWSNAKLSVSTDLLPSLAAVADYFGGSDEYVAGLWTADLCNGLLWIVWETAMPMSHRQYIGPTWSWVSVGKPIIYCLWHGVREDLAKAGTELVVREVKYEMDDRSSIVGRLSALTSASLEISAMTKSLLDLDEVKACDLFFDDLSYERNWRRGKPTLLAFINPWTSSWTNSKEYIRCIGLILTAQDGDDDGASEATIAHRRVGVFLGLAYEEEMPGWTRQNILII